MKFIDIEVSLNIKAEKQAYDTALLELWSRYYDKEMKKRGSIASLIKRLNGNGPEHKRVRLSHSYSRNVFPEGLKVSTFIKQWRQLNNMCPA